MNTRQLLQYFLIALLVIILGGFAGWYYYLRTSTQTISTQDSERGFGVAAPLGTPDDTAATPLPTQQNGEAIVPPPQLWEVSTTPVAGIAFVASSTLRYAERATGYVFDANPTTGDVERRSNTLMPKTYEAFFGAGDSVIERTVDPSGAITTFSGALSTSTPGDEASSTPLVGAQLETGIEHLALAPNSQRMFYITGETGAVTGVESNLDGTKKTKPFTSAMNDWDVSWLADGRIILAQSAADALPGYAYVLNGDGSLSPLISDVPGLTVLPRSGSSTIIWGESSGEGLKLFARESASTTVETLPIQTIADKCVWAPGVALIAYCAVPQTAPTGDYLDLWYRGETHSSDVIWQVDANTGEAAILYTPTKPIDAADLIVDPSGTYLAFVNTIDETAWVLRLSQ